MIKSITTNNIQIYHLSAGKTLPQFIKEAKGELSLKKDKEFRRRLELIQDFEFPVSCSRLRISSNGEYIGAVGIYPPELRVFDVNELGLKFQRGFDSEVVDFDFLSSDYRKSVFLHADRNIEFHSQGGRHHRLRIPKAGRALKYLQDTAELLIVGSVDEIYRLDLESGIFESPIRTKCDEINCVKNSPTLPIVCVGGSNGLIETFDHRKWTSAATLPVVQDSDDGGNGRHVTALDFSSDGMTLCAGTAAGICRVYDIRSSRPVAERDHRNLLPIVDLQIVEKAKHIDGAFSNARLTVLSADKKAVKIWNVEGNENYPTIDGFSSYSNFGNQKQTKLVASLEQDKVLESGSIKMEKTAGAINSVVVYPQSGLIFVGQDNPRICIYFVPQLGLAPKWCSFLDSLTEEMEESVDDTVYDDFQFVTKSELEEFGAQHLIGTPVLRAYMHGYFMDARLYYKLKAISQPFALEEYRKQKIQEKINNSRKMRIQIKRKLPTVNQELAARLEENATSANQRTATMATSILKDDRFSKLFLDPSFAIEPVPLHNLSASSQPDTARIETVLNSVKIKSKRRKT